MKILTENARYALVELPSLRLMPADRLGNRSAFRRYAVDNGPINLQNFAFGKLTGQIQVRLIAFSHHQQTGSIFIQTVDYSGTLYAMDTGQIPAVSQKTVD